jgi:hypothetical protein
MASLCSLRVAAGFCPEGEFRQGKPLLLTLFLILYYGATVCLWAASFPAGIIPYLVVSLLFLLQAGLSIALRIKEVRQAG